MKYKNRMHYAKKRGPFSAQSLALRTPASSASWKLYQSCDKIDLERFLDVLFDKEFDRLIIEGAPPEAAIKEAWNAIYLQYSELANDGTYNETLDKVMQVNTLNAKIFLVDGIVKHLMLAYDKKLVGILHNMGYPCDLKEGEDPEAKLKNVVARAKRLVVQMDIAQKDLERLQGIHHETSGRDSFDDGLDALSKHRGYTVRAKDITVTQFLRSIKRLNEETLKIQHARH